MEWPVLFMDFSLMATKGNNLLLGRKMVLKDYIDIFVNLLSKILVVLKDYIDIFVNLSSKY